MGHSPEHGNLSGPDSPQLISMQEGLEHTCCCAAVWLDLVPGLMQAVPVLWVHDCSSRTKLLTLRLLHLFPPPFRLGDGGVKIDVPFRIEHSFLLLTAFWVIMHLTVDCPPLLRELSLAKAESSPVVGVGTGHTYESLLRFFFWTTKHSLVIFLVYNDWFMSAVSVAVSFINLGRHHRKDWWEELISEDTCVFSVVQCVFYYYLKCLLFFFSVIFLFFLSPAVLLLSFRINIFLQTVFTEPKDFNVTFT